VVTGKSLMSGSMVGSCVRILITSQAGLLLSSRTIISFVLFAMILPIASSLLLTRFRLRPLAKDILLARVSLVFMAIGALGIGLADGLVLLVVGTVLLSVGSGYNLLALSLLSSLVKDGHAGLLYSAVGVLDNIGPLLAGPLIAAIFRLGLAWGNQWIGLPYLVVGLFYALSMFIVGFVRLGETRLKIDQSDSGDEDD
jgi:MFS family permease